MSKPSKHALIIEDEMLIGMGMQDVLTEIGFGSFAFASTARQAVEQAGLRRPDLVTADIGLLDGDGLEACRALEAAYGALSIIYVTGHDPEELREPGRIVVIKPFSAADMQAACEAVGGHSQPA